MPGFDEAVAADEAERYDLEEGFEEDFDPADETLLEATGPVGEREAIDFFDNLEQALDDIADDESTVEEVEDFADEDEAEAETDDEAEAETDDEELAEEEVVEELEN